MRNKLSIPSTFEVALSEEDLQGALTETKGLWLGRYDLDQLRSDLEQSGVLPHLRERGYTDLSPTVEVEPFQSNLRITGRIGSETYTLVEIETRRTRERVIDDAEGKLYSTLILDWVLFQDPCAEFGEEHPRLPGQEYPGLHLLGRGSELLVEQVRGLDVELVLTYPRHFHNAVFYAPRFEFLDPTTEGHFRALRRDLLSQDGELARASSALEEGRIVDEAGHPVHWLAKALVFPQTEAAQKELLGSEKRRLAVERAFQTRFRYL